MCFSINLGDIELYVNFGDFKLTNMDEELQNYIIFKFVKVCNTFFEKTHCKMIMELMSDCTYDEHVCNQFVLVLGVFKKY